MSARVGNAKCETVAGIINSLFIICIDLVNYTLFDKQYDHWIFRSEQEAFVLSITQRGREDREVWSPTSGIVCS